MKQILFLVPGWRAGSATAQAILAAQSLPKDRFQIFVVALGPEDSASRPLHEAGIPTASLKWQRWFDANPLRRLSGLASVFRPDATFTWGLEALRAAVLLPQKTTGKVIAADLFPFSDSLAWRIFDRWALGRPERIVVSGAYEYGSALEFGVPESRLEIVPPGIKRRQTCALATEAQGRLFLAVGPLERNKGLQDAIWAFEILRPLYPDLELVIAGQGPDEPRLREFVRAIEATEKVQFLGYQNDLCALYARATLVLIPSTANRGVRVALEAMNWGKPVIATRWPRLAEIVADGETGCLVRPGDKTGISRRAHSLLADPPTAHRLGANASARIERDYSAAAFAERLGKLLA